MKIIIVAGISIALGIICGSGSVYAFNHMPDEWLGTDERGREWQRVKSVPWKYIFTATFIVVGIYLGMKDSLKAPGYYASCLLLTQTAMAGFLYGRTPRPVVWLLALTGVGILPFTIDEDLGFGAGSEGMIKAHLAGAAAGFVLVFVLLMIKKLVLRNTVKQTASAAETSEQDKAGAGTAPGIDWALCELGLALGLLCGPVQVSVIIAAGIVLWGGHAVSKRFGNAGNKLAGNDTLMKNKIGEAFFIAVSAMVCIIVWPF